MSEKKLFFLFFLPVFSAILLFAKHARAQNMPVFNIQQTNGTGFSSKNLSPDKPVIIIYFSPDCEHCQVLMNELFNKIKDFKKAQIVMVTFKPVSEVVEFEKQYQTSRFPNIRVGIEIPVFFFRKYYALENTPFTALFDKKGKLIISYKNETPVEDLIKHLKALNQNK